MLKKLFSVRSSLTILLILSIIFAAYSAYYKMKYWGFEFFPNKVTNIWTVEANITFEATGDPIKVSFAIPNTQHNLKILDEKILADGYKVKRVSNGINKIELTAKNLTGTQSVYYRIMLYDNENAKGKTKAPAPKKPSKPDFDEKKLAAVKQIIILSEKEEGDAVQQLIKVFNQTPLSPAVLDFISIKNSQKETVEAITAILAYKKIPSRIVRGIKLEEDKKSFSPDMMIEAYIGESWRIYDIKTAAKGIPENFVVFQRGGESLLDVEGGVNSSVKFSAIKSVSSSLNMVAHRAKFNERTSLFEFSIYNLPLAEQNILKWFMIFPLAILIVVLMRNVVGLTTMGTFTPMLLAMALVKTGFWQGMICFTLIVGLGLLIRALLSKFNLLLVPRISAVVIFVILLMQILTIGGYKFSIEAALSAAFFPIIIMAWIIERASITWEEEGALNAGKEVFNSLIVALITYAVISNEYIRYIMFAFNEFNFVILFIVMLLGTYTGYRFTELTRFAPLVKKG